MYVNDNAIKSRSSKKLMELDPELLQIPSYDSVLQLCGPRPPKWTRCIYFPLVAPNNCHAPRDRIVSSGPVSPSLSIRCLHVFLLVFLTYSFSKWLGAGCPQYACCLPQRQARERRTSQIPQNTSLLMYDATLPSETK